MGNFLHNSLFAAAVLLPLSLSARADTIKNFSLNSDLSGGYTAQGQVSIDVTDGQVVNSFFTVTQNGAVDATFTQADYSQPLSGVYLAEFADHTDGFTYELLLPNSTLVGYNGGNVCTLGNTCIGYPSGVYLPSGLGEGALDGTLTPTPEPASFLMLGTGLLAGYLVARRRWIRSSPEN
ncbi:MAG TPA: PEP-CTERM sorting domain-containing protein [Acidobacteriaceae bacterium]|nr:PEP-CTERM sorting domain-containing protein [Acidobacteriaceae bacterium]